MKRTILCLGTVCLLLAPTWLCQAAEPQRPNVIFILSDDQNADTLGCFGGKVLTSRLDRLAQEGVRFTRAYSVSSVCTPSRYICLTGQYASRCQSTQFLRACPPGTPAVVGFNVTIQSDTPNLARVLQQAGYRTGFVGKWHTGGPGMRPYPSTADIRDPQTVKVLQENQQRLCNYIESCGFDYAASVYRGNLADHKLEALDVHNMEWITKGALDFLEQNKDRPFFLHVCTTLQHSPAPNKSLSGDPRVTPVGLLDEPLKVQAARESIGPRLKEAGVAEHMGHATWLDDGVAAILDKLRELDVADNTVILFFSDNGTMRGKGTCYEGGARTPALLYWKDHIPAGQVCDKLIANIDFVPTVLDICGVQPPESLHLDGASLLPLVSGKRAKWREALLLDVGHTRAVCTDKWKYIALRYPPARQAQIKAGTLGRKPYHMDTVFDLQQVAEKAHPGYWAADQLYDLGADPAEKVNLAMQPQHAQQVSQMKEVLRNLLSDFPRPFGEFKN